ncbi:MAG: methionyl-tRNA formyltransferase [Chloroflexota bacterium]
MSGRRLIFMGSDSFSLPILSALLKSAADVHIDVAAIVTQPDRPTGRGRVLATNPVKTMAGQFGVSVLQPERIRSDEAMSQLASLAPDVMVVAAYGQILPQALLDLPSHGVLNLHPSLLPRFRGPTPVQGAILAGDGITGTTLMLLEVRMDAGPIISQECIDVAPEETTGELESRLAVLSAQLLQRDLVPWLEGRLVARPQDNAAATYTHLLSKHDGVIDWTRPAGYVARQVRAMNPWPMATTTWRESAVRITRARTGPGGSLPGQVFGLMRGLLAVGCGDYALMIQEMQLAGGRPLSPDVVVRGHPDLLQARFGD